MKYIFMHNFRGFSDTILPLKQLTFLVGENSTGKSSFLKLLNLLSHSSFWFSPEYAFQDEADLGGFDDMVSAWSKDQSFFQIGSIILRKQKDKPQQSYVFTLHEFSNRDGSPVVTRYLQFTEGHLIKIIFERKRTKYKALTMKTSPCNDEEALELFRQLVRDDRNDTNGFSLFPKEYPPSLPIPVVVEIIRSIIKDKSFDAITPEIPLGKGLSWIAPIRTKPKRFYDGMRKTFSPEGDHTPFILRKRLRAKTKSREFAEKLKVFGKSSGLYEAIAPHSFDRSPQSPFEILVNLSGAELNINNVGYGVSQVLPLIVEFLSREKGRTFAIQQPEVHLHPRAQAALGDLVVELAREKDHRFLFETHSDYLIDRCRLNLAGCNDSPEAQVIFFQRTEQGNLATVLQIDDKGRYPAEQPTEFRDFFIKEEIRLLEV